MARTDVNSGECSSEKVREVISLVRTLLEDAPLFFDKREYLNSDGRRVLRKILASCQDGRIHYYAKTVIRDSSVYNVVKLAETLGIAYDPLEIYRDSWRIWLSKKTRNH
jgi:hypothetical protein